MTIRTFRHPDGQSQRLAVADLLDGQGATFRSLLSGPVAVIYSDPPWNPGNEKWWRRHAGAEPPCDYNDLLDAWCRCVIACQPQHVLVEQSVNPRHKGMLIEAIGRCAGWDLPLVEEWAVQYGSLPRPNALLHFGGGPLRTDPSGMSGEAMTRRVFAGLLLTPGGTVADPCMGKGMTSRMAHEFGQHCIGTELCGRRLDVTLRWLLRHGYSEVAG